MISLFSPFSAFPRSPWFSSHVPPSPYFDKKIIKVWLICCSATKKRHWPTQETKICHIFDLAILEQRWSITPVTPKCWANIPRWPLLIKWANMRWPTNKPETWSPLTTANLVTEIEKVVTFASSSDPPQCSRHQGALRRTGEKNETCKIVTSSIAAGHCFSLEIFFREGSGYQIGWFFWKSSKGGGVHFQSKNLYCRFWELFLSMKLKQKE